MAIGLYRPALSRPVAVHCQCGSWRYMPARDTVPRSAAQSRPATCTSLGGTDPRDSDQQMRYWWQSSPKSSHVSSTKWTLFSFFKEIVALKNTTDFFGCWASDPPLVFLSIHSTVTKSHGCCLCNRLKLQSSDTLFMLNHLQLSSPWHTNRFESVWNGLLCLTRAKRRIQRRW